MENNQANTKRIAKNTLMLYVRMLFSMLVSLYTSRVVLNTLGVEDYGIYNVVGGFVMMFSLISSALSSSTSRFLTFELGRGDLDRLKRVFATSVWIHIALAAVIFVLMETVGVWFLNNKMTIPLERMTAANWVFQASIVSFLMGLFTVPYNASIISHERMSAFAYIGILDVVLKLAIVLFIAYSPWNFDKLIVYALLLVAVALSMQFIYIVYCKRNFIECRLRLFFDKSCWKEMSSFAGWNFIGCTAGLLKDQGVNILLNLFGGPVLNAARGISTTVNNAIGAFSSNFMVALNPQITKSYAVGERQYMFSLVERGSRFSFYILFIIALPFFFETDFILTLWLKQYPEHTVNFVRLILIVSLSDVLSNTLINLQSATGKIRNYQIVVGGMLLMNFPLSYICLKVGAHPESVFIVAIVVSVTCLFLRLLFLRKMVGLSMVHFFKAVCLNVLTVVFVAFPIPLFICLNMSDGWFRFGMICCVSMACSLSSVLLLGCTKTERKFIFEKIVVLRNKLR